MNSVTNINEYMRRSEKAETTIAPTASTGWTVVSEYPAGGEGFLSAGVVRKINPDAELSKLLELIADTLAAIEDCKSFLRSDPFSADNKFMAIKALTSELLMFRDISDAIGLLLMKCFQVASKITTITDAPRIPDALANVLTRLWSAPFMDFLDACSIADKLEKTAGLVVLPSYHSLAAELIGDADADTPE